MKFIKWPWSNEKTTLKTAKPVDSVSIEQMLQDQEFPHIATAEFLQDYNNPTLAKALISLPQQTYDKLGETALIWAWMQQDHTFRGAETIESIIKRNGCQLYVSAVSDTTFNGHKDLSNTLKMHQFIDTNQWFIQNPPYIEPSICREIVQRNSKRTLSEKQLDRYAMKLCMPNAAEVRDITTLPYSGKEKYIVHMDAPLGIALYFNERPEAIISCYPRTSNTLVIRQMQGIPQQTSYKHPTHQNWGLEPIGFGALIDALDHLAENQYSKIVVRSGADHPYLKDVCGDDEYNIDFWSAVKRYDWTAARNGFVFYEGEWHKSQGLHRKNRTIGATRFAQVLPALEMEYLKKVHLTRQEMTNRK